MNNIIDLMNRSNPVQPIAEMLEWAQTYSGHVDPRSGLRSNADCVGGILDSMAEHTKAYRTDIVYDLCALHDAIHSFPSRPDCDTETPVYVIGIRENGIDHAAFVHSRLKNRSRAEYLGGIWLITLTQESETRISVKVYRAKED